VLSWLEGGTLRLCKSNTARPAHVRVRVRGVRVQRVSQVQFLRSVRVTLRVRVSVGPCHSCGVLLPALSYHLFRVLSLFFLKKKTHLSDR
jgi:hypothetical protein